MKTKNPNNFQKIMKTTFWVQMKNLRVMILNISVIIIFMNISINLKAHQKNDSIFPYVRQLIQYQFIREYLDFSSLDSVSLMKELAWSRMIQRIEIVPVTLNDLLIEGKMYKITFDSFISEPKKYIVWINDNAYYTVAYRLKGFRENDYPAFRETILLKYYRLAINPIAILHWKRQFLFKKWGIAGMIPEKWSGYLLNDLIQQSEVDFDCLENAYRNKGEKYCDCLISYEKEFQNMNFISTAPPPRNAKELREKEIMGKFHYEENPYYPIRNRFPNVEIEKRYE